MTVLFLLTVLTLYWILDVILSIFGTTNSKDQVSGMRLLSVFEQVILYGHLVLTYLVFIMIFKSFECL